VENAEFVVAFVHVAVHKEKNPAAVPQVVPVRTPVHHAVQKLKHPKPVHVAQPPLPGVAVAVTKRHQACIAQGRDCHHKAVWCAQTQA
jgi:hypothetical protein